MALALLAGAGAARASAAAPAGDPDGFWHIAMGRDLLRDGLSRTDAFSWTVTGVPVLTDQWLGQLGLGLAYESADPVLRRQQDLYLGRIKQLGDDLGLPSYIGEGYATAFWSDEPELSWDWIKEISAAAVRTVQQLGFAGWTTSNFSEPSFPLWEDTDWHHSLLKETVPLPQQVDA